LAGVLWRAKTSVVGRAWLGNANTAIFTWVLGFADVDEVASFTGVADGAVALESGKCV